MPRRVSLPGAEELFRGMPGKPTAADSIEPGAAPHRSDDRDAPGQLSPEADHTGPESDHAGPELVEGRSSTSSDRGTAGSDRGTAGSDRGTAGSDRGTAGPDAAAEPDGNGRGRNRRRGSGRVRHDEKITVYVSRDELLNLERARLSLRAEYGMAVDRGRIVREALAMVLDDLAENGEQSDLARRLTQP